jgi:hypothetical protein
VFKDTYGFDTDTFTLGLPIKITDDELNEKPRGIFKNRIFSDGLDYDWENKCGIYLVKHSSSTILTLTDSYGNEVKLPIRHFLGDDPRMTIYLNNGWKE